MTNSGGLSLGSYCRTNFLLLFGAAIIRVCQLDQVRAYGERVLARDPRYRQSVDMRVPPKPLARSASFG